MTDEIDRANDHAQTMLEAEIKQQRIAPPTIAATGNCLCCDEPTAEKRWCDAFCRDDWQKRERVKAWQIN